MLIQNMFINFSVKVSCPETHLDYYQFHETFFCNLCLKGEQFLIIASTEGESQLSEITAL